MSIIAAWLDAAVIAQMRGEAKRLGVPVAQVMQRAWVLAQREMAQIPGQEPFTPAREGMQFYLGVQIAREVVAEAARLDRSVSWVLWQAWKIARAEIMSAPVPTDPE